MASPATRPIRSPDCRRSRKSGNDRAIRPCRRSTRPPPIGWARRPLRRAHEVGRYGRQHRPLTAWAKAVATPCADRSHGGRLCHPTSVPRVNPRSPANAGGRCGRRRRIARRSAILVSLLSRTPKARLIRSNVAKTSLMAERVMRPAACQSDTGTSPSHGVLLVFAVATQRRTWRRCRPDCRRWRPADASIRPGR